MVDNRLVALLELIRYRAARAIRLLKDYDLEGFLASEDAQDTAFACNHDIGEAIDQLAKSFPAFVHRISNYRKIIDSRHVMSHALFVRDFERLWNNFEDGIPILHEEVCSLLDEILAQGPS